MGDGTRKVKKTAIRNFYDFLQGVGIVDIIMTHVDFTSDKSRVVMLREEDCLCAYASMRVMAGQSPAGVLQYVSHIRTAYRHVWRTSFGMVGSISSKSYTSAFIFSLREYFPRSDSSEKKRLPITKPILLVLVNAATMQNNLNMAAVMATCWGGLFRTGELTATDGPFNPRNDVSQADVILFRGFGMLLALLSERVLPSLTKQGRNEAKTLVFCQLLPHQFVLEI